MCALQMLAHLSICCQYIFGHMFVLLVTDKGFFYTNTWGEHGCFIGKALTSRLNGFLKKNPKPPSQRHS